LALEAAGQLLKQIKALTVTTQFFLLLLLLVEVGAVVTTIKPELMAVLVAVALKHQGELETHQALPLLKEITAEVVLALQFLLLVAEVVLVVRVLIIVRSMVVMVV
jgi:hypothetical protein